jgi:hypothetical protein
VAIVVNRRFLRWDEAVVGQEDEDVSGDLVVG